MYKSRATDYGSGAAHAAHALESIWVGVYILGVNSFGIYNSRAADFGSGASHACPHEALYKILQRKSCVRNQNIFCAVCDRFSRWENKRLGGNLGIDVVCYFGPCWASKRSTIEQHQELTGKAAFDCR